MTRNRITFATIASFLFALGISATANAQYLISTKAGFVNRADGKVFIQRADSVDGEKGRASLGTQMRDGDTVSTAATSYAEILMNPGSYVRLSENSEIRAVNTDFDAVRFELIKGTAIAEVGEIEKKSPIEIVTAHGTLTLATGGLHRIDEKGAVTVVSVRQGEIYLGSRSDLAANKAVKIGHGKVVTLDGNGPVDKADIAKLDKDALDNFDQWSFNRAQTLTAANVSALRRSQSLTAFSGGWYYSPFFNCYTFMPYGSQYFSPYGFRFFNNYGAAYYYSPYYYYGGGGGYYGGGGTTSASRRAIAGNDSGQVRRATSGRETGGRGVDSGSGFGAQRGGFSDASSSSRSISAPSTTTSSPSVISAPAPSRGGGGAMPSRGRP